MNIVRLVRCRTAATVSFEDILQENDSLEQGCQLCFYIFDAKLIIFSVKKYTLAFFIFSGGKGHGLLYPSRYQNIN